MSHYSALACGLNWHDNSKGKIANEYGAARDKALQAGLKVANGLLAYQGHSTGSWPVQKSMSSNA